MRASIVGFHSMRKLDAFLLPIDDMLVHRRVNPPASNSPVSVYKAGWREALRESSVLPKNKAQTAYTDLRELTSRPLRLLQYYPHTVTNSVCNAVQEMS